MQKRNNYILKLFDIDSSSHNSVIIAIFVHLDKTQ